MGGKKITDRERMGMGRLRRLEKQGVPVGK
jgi:hypothetical protein